MCTVSRELDLKMHTGKIKYNYKCDFIYDKVFNNNNKIHIQNKETEEVEFYIYM